jgi:hypothetical protein
VVEVRVWKHRFGQGTRGTAMEWPTILGRGDGARRSREVEFACTAVCALHGTTNVWCDVDTDAVGSGVSSEKKPRRVTHRGSAHADADVAPPGKTNKKPRKSAAGGSTTANAVENALRTEPMETNGR